MIGGGSGKARQLAKEAAAGARENVHAQGTIEQDFVSSGTMRVLCELGQGGYCRKGIKRRNGDAVGASVKYAWSSVQ